MCPVPKFLMSIEQMFKSWSGDLRTFLRYLRICEMRVDKACKQGDFSDPLEDALAFYRLCSNSLPDHVAEAITHSDRDIFAERDPTAFSRNIARASNKLSIETEECAAPEIGLANELISTVKVMNRKKT